jgi:hypothetical protein
VSRELVFIHGRAQQGKDAAALKASWIDAWRQGLAKSDLELPIAESAIHFPFYGDTLAALVDGTPAPDVIVKGPDDADEEERQMVAEALEEAREARGISDDAVLAEAHTEAIEKGPMNWRWVRAIATALDARLPGASGTTLALATADVYQYLRNPGVRDEIEDGVRGAMPSGVETVVVSHSLGTVVAYNLLRREAAENGWSVPLLVTLGSPLAVTAIRKRLMPFAALTPQVSAWFNAMDPNDIVALYPLGAPRFDVRPTIENKVDVDNHTPNEHGIAGYLDDAVVARRIHDALIA